MTDATTRRAELIGSNTCTACGITVRRHAPVLAMCRRMIEAGHDPSARLEVYRGAVLALTVRSIGEGSQLTVKSASSSRKPKGIVPQPRPCAKRAGPPPP